MKNILIALFLFLLASPLKAVLPESGWYWNPNAGGSGFNIEVQDDKMFVAAFTYDVQGRSIFYTIGGVLNVNTGTLTSTLFVTSGGQCVGCPYVAPTTTAVAPAEIYFPTSRTARVRVFLAGGTAEISLVRFVFGYAGARAQEHLGVWSIIEESLGVFFGEALQMNALCTLSGLTDSFCGSRLGSSSRVAVGASVPGSTAFIVLLDSSTSYYNRFIYTNDTNRWAGLSATYLKTGTVPATSSGLSFIATRLAGPSTASQIGLAAPVPIVDLTSLELRDKALATGIAKQSSNAIDELPEDVRKALLAIPDGEIDRITRELQLHLSGK